MLAFFLLPIFLAAVVESVPGEPITDPVLQMKIFNTFSPALQATINSYANLYGAILYHEVDDVCVYISAYHGPSFLQPIPPGRFRCPIMAGSVVTASTPQPVTLSSTTPIIPPGTTPRRTPTSSSSPRLPSTTTRPSSTSTMRDYTGRRFRYRPSVDDYYT